MCKTLTYLFLWVVVLLVSGPAGAVLDDWQAAVEQGSPGFFATGIADGLYDIGPFSGDITYEFVVRSNPAETQASMCLIGRRDFGDTQAGLKYEQWNNTGTYGATVFGVMDYDFGAPNSPGEDTHLVFLSSEASATTALYVNGVYQASVPTAVTLSGVVGIGCGAQDEAARGSAFFDDFDGDIFGVAIYDVALSDGEIKARSDAFFRPEPVNPGSQALVAYYAFENDANDSSVNGHNGTLVGGPAYVQGLAGYGIALDFDGTDDVVELGRFDVVGGGITLAAWIRPDSFAINDGRIISKAKEWGANDHWWMLSTVTSGADYVARFRLKTDESETVPTLIGASGILTAGQWSHVTATWDGASMVLYVDGVEAGRMAKGGSAVAVDPNVSVAIGSQPSDAFAPATPSHVVKFFDGLIDEVRIYARALSKGELLHLAGQRARPVDPGTEGLVAYYALDSDANDSSDNGLHGTIKGNVVPTDDRFGDPNAAMQFGGASGDHVDLGDPQELQLTGAMTLSAWVMLDGTNTNNGRVVAKAGGGGARSWSLNIEASSGGVANPATFQISPTGASNISISDREPLPTDEWLHMAGVYKPGEAIEVYVNGERKAADTTDIPASQFSNNNRSVLIGSRNNCSNCGWLGSIDDVGIYQRALSVGEIRYLAGYRAPVDPGTEGLVVHYAFENDVNDSSVNALHGTIVGDPTFAAGRLGMALDFDGNGDYLDCGTNVTLNSLNAAMSASAWINIRSVTTAWMAVMAKGENAWRISVNNQTTGLHFGFSGGDRGWQAANSASQVTLNEWHHVAATYDLQNGAQIYIDGAVDGSNLDLGGVQMNEMPFLIGENPEAAGRFFDGFIDEVAVYDRALSEPEVRFIAGER